jgi:hypothetical protein
MNRHATVTTPPRAVHQFAWWSLGSLALSLLGAFGPWATYFGYTVNGVDTDDGKLCLGAVGIALVVTGIAIWRRARFLYLMPAVIAVLVAVAGVADATDLNDGVSVGWGLYLMIVAAISCVIACVALTVALKPKAV